MANDPRVPRSDEDFNDYINRTTDHLQLSSGGITNWDRLNLSSGENNQWKAFRTGWNDKYEIVKDNEGKDITDRNAIKKKNKAKKDFNDWVLDPAMNKLNRIGASPDITDTDRSIFNIKLRDDTPTARPKITTAPAVDMNVEDGAIVAIACRVQKDSKRTSMHPDADVVEMVYIMQPIDDPAPTDPEALPNTETSTKALFRFSAGVPNAGKRLYAYLRWRNNTEPEKSGPWAQRMTIVISD